MKKEKEFRIEGEMEEDEENEEIIDIGDDI